MKNLFLSVLLLLPSIVAIADDYSYFAFQDTDGTDVFFDAMDLKITVSSGNLIVTSSSETRSLSLSTLNYMVFTSSTINGIDVLKSSDSSVKVSDGQIAVVADNGAKVRVYSISGMVVGGGTATGGTDYYGAALSPGIYIVSVNGKTTKVVLR